MAMLCFDPVALFHDSFPSDMQREIVRVLRSMYPDSRQLCESLVAKHHARDMLAGLKRGLIENKLEELKDRYPGVKVRVEQNRSGNSHVVIETDRFILTESYVSTPKTPVRRAAYRESDSYYNYPLFQRSEKLDEVQDEIKLNAILLHGYGPKRTEDLGFAWIRFPRPGGKGYIQESINLLERHQASPTIIAPDAVEEIPDLIDPKINKQPKRQD